MVKAAGQDVSLGLKELLVELGDDRHKAIVRDALKRLKSLESDLFQSAVDRANNLANVERIQKWFFSSPRRSAVHAFTDGPERQIAFLIEQAEIGGSIVSGENFR